MSEDLKAPVLAGRGASDYERYLRTDELLALQKRPEERVHHDELLFQTVHQSSELWLKLACSEVDEAAAALERDDLGAAARLLRRSVLALQYVTTNLDMLNQMDPWEYQQIRVVLGHDHRPPSRQRPPEGFGQGRQAALLADHQPTAPDRARGRP